VSPAVYLYSYCYSFHFTFSVGQIRIVYITTCLQCHIMKIVHFLWQKVTATLTVDWSQVLLEKLLVTQLVSKFPAFYGI
jgi:hypothetical protein